MLAKKPNQMRGTITLILIVLAIITIFNFLNLSDTNIKDVPISTMAEQVKKGEVEKIAVDNNEITAQLKNGVKERSFKESDAKLNDYGITSEKVAIEVKNPDRGSLLPTLLSVVLPFLLVGVFLYFIIRSSQGMNNRALSFGRSPARMMTGTTKTTFTDVAGLIEPKQELQEVVEFLKTPEKFKRLGADIPKGVLLIGPPGCGKTLLAKAVAGEAGVPFFSISASEFVEMFVGVGAARVRDLFLKAKRNAPAILFIDELDAVGRQRGSGLGGSHDEREQTLNQILVEMDGFETDARVIIMAATNRPDVLDPALLRPGRFDRRITIDLPDRGERKEILGVYARNKPLEEGVDLERIAGATAGFSGADLKNIMNEAAILAGRANRKTITAHVINEAIEKVMMGPERRSRILTNKEKEITATHELGHALVGHLLPHTDPIHKVSIISRGGALGYTWSVPKEDRRLVAKSKFEDEIAQLLGGRAAEIVFYREITTGAANDLERATKLARDMVTSFGMSEKLGPVTLGTRDEMIFLGREFSEGRGYSEEVAAQIDKEVRAIIEQAQERSIALIRRHKATLVTIRERLLKEETIDGSEFETYFEKLESPLPSKARA